MFKATVVICFSCFILVPDSFGQKQSNVWCFGKKAKVDFNSGNPMDASPSAINTDEGCASIADNNGNLLFYTDGSFLWDKNDLKMPNGSGLKGHSSSTQSAIITPVINKMDQYYIFTVRGYSCGPPPHELNYSILDMNLPGNGTVGNPTGDIISSSKNIFLNDSTAEKITAILHDDQVSYWIVVPIANADTFYSYHVNCNGVDPTPVISTLNNFKMIVNPSSDLGYLKASADGKTLAAAFYYNSTLALFDFDNSTGTVSNPRKIVTNFTQIYGIEFSPNDSLIYASGIGSIKQYQRFDPNVGSTEVQVFGSAAFGMQLASNGKIYFSQYTNNLSSIDDPNTISTPGISKTTVSLSGTANTNRGLPNYFGIYINGGLGGYNGTFYVCDGDSVELGPNPVAGYQYSWSPATFLSNTAISRPYARPSVTTSYQFSTIDACNDTLVGTVVVIVNPLPSANFTAGPLSGCKPLTVVFTNTSTPSSIYCNWTLGDDSTSANLNPVHIYQNPGNYSVKLLITDNNGCKDSISATDYITVFKDPLAAFTFDPGSASIIDPVIEFTDSSVSDYGPISSWNWLFSKGNGDTSAIQSPSYTYQDTGLFQVRLIVVDINGCRDTAYHIIQVHSDFVFYAPNSFTPNGDGTNDIFRVYTRGILSFRMTIFDRWGNAIFKSNDVAQGWNGSINNKTPAEEEVYVYSISVLDYKGKEHNFRDRITLIR